MASNPIIAINISKVSNTPESYQLMQKVGPKVCITTAKHPGFLGFEQLLQTGIHPMGGRFGGGALDMRETLNPIGMYQYTVWKDVKSHEEMHYQQFDTIYELCGACLDMLVEGPWEPLYEIRSSDLPPVLAMTDVPTPSVPVSPNSNPCPRWPWPPSGRWWWGTTGSWTATSRPSRRGR